MTLAALFAMTAGAWADGTLQVTEIKASEFSAWDGDNTALSAADLPGFKAATEAEAKAWADAPASGMAVLFYDFKESGEAKYVVFENGAYMQSNEQTISRTNVYSNLGSFPTFYTSGASSEPSAQTVAVTPVTGKTNQWTLNMPAGNVVFQVEYDPWKVTLLTNNDQWGTVEAVTGGGVKEFTVPDAWSGDETAFSAADLPGFAASTLEEAQAWDGYPTSGFAYLIYGFTSEGEMMRIGFYDGNATYPSQVNSTHAYMYNNMHDGGSGADRYYYTAASDVTANADGTYSVVPGKSITLKATPAEGYRLAGWYKVDGAALTALTEADGAVADAEAGTLTLTPEADLTIRAQFAELTYTVTLNDKTYQTNANVTATVAGSDAIITEDGKIEGVTKGQTVILKANTGYKFRKVEAKEGAAAAKVEITIGDVTLDITGCTTWEDIVNQNSDKLDVDNDGDVYRKDIGRNLLHGSGSWVNKSRTYNANDGYYWYTGEI